MAIRRRIVSAWISTVISLSLVLLLVGVGTLMLVNARAVSDYFKENMQVSVLLKEQVNEEEALKYQDRVAALPGVRSTHFVSREQGVEEMARMLGRRRPMYRQTAWRSSSPSWRSLRWWRRWCTRPRW